MPAIRFDPGTKSPGTPSAYTDAQWAALEGVKQVTPALKYGAARAEFVNRVMLADGMISDNLDGVAAAAAAQAPDESGNIVEFQRSLAEKRFLFIVDVDLVPRIYFQCAVAGNPDVELADAPSKTGGLFSKLGGLFGAVLLAVAVGTMLHMVHLGDVAPYFFLIGTLDLKNSTAEYALDQLYDNKFPAGSIVRIRTGAVAGAENADSGTVLATITTPATPWAAAASGSKAKNGTWQDAAADATGTAQHFRFSNAAGTECEEGTVTATSGGGDMEVDNTSIALGQVVTVTTYTRTL